MEKLKKVKLISIVLSLVTLSLFIACSTEDDTTIQQNEGILTQTDKEALLFMFEEEKLARDTYQYLNNLWSLNQFANIKVSEQTHMNLVSNLLDYYKVPYTLLPDGEFANQELQKLYNQFAVNGQLSLINALKIGATIEDLDIVDLENNLNATTNTSIIAVFENLQCGSRNHLRSFVTSIENLGATYTPQYLSNDAYILILNDNHEQCN